jgi:hypothetical protein
LQQCTLELRDREGIEFVIEAAVAGLLKGDSHAVVHKSVPPHLGDGHCEQDPSRFRTKVVIRSAADREIAFFKRVRERERVPELLIVHGFSSYPENEVLDIALRFEQAEALVQLLLGGGLRDLACR